MNDFDYDVMQKKRIAHSARHMKRGSKSRKCALPSDHMTAAEWKRRNGTVNTYSMNLPMSWEHFKLMPPDLQQSYIDRLQDRFGISLSQIGTELFGVSIGCLRLYANRHGLKYKTYKGQKLDDETSLLWKCWLNRTNAEDVEKSDEPETAEIPAECFCEPEGLVKQIEEAAAPEDVAEPDEEDYKQVFHNHGKSFEASTPEEIPAEDEEVGELTMTYLSAVFEGEFSPERFLSWITKLPMPDGKIRIRVKAEAL